MNVLNLKNTFAHQETDEFRPPAKPLPFAGVLNDIVCLIVQNELFEHQQAWEIWSETLLGIKRPQWGQRIEFPETKPLSGVLFVKGTTTVCAKP